MKLPGRRQKDQDDKKPDRRNDPRSRDRGRAGRGAADDDQFNSFRNRRNRLDDRDPRDDNDDDSGGRSFLGLSFGGGNDNDDDKPAQATGRYGQSRRGQDARPRNARDAKQDDDDSGGRSFLGLSFGGGDDEDQKDDRSRGRGRGGDKNQDKDSGGGWLRRRSKGKGGNKQGDRSPRSKPFVSGSMEDRNRSRRSGGRDDDRSAGSGRRSSRPSNKPSYLGSPDRSRSQGRDRPGGPSTSRPSLGSPRDRDQERDRDRDWARDRDRDRDRSRPGSIGSSRPSFSGPRDRDQGRDRDRDSTRDRDRDRDRDRSRPGSIGSSRPSFSGPRDRDQGRDRDQDQSRSPGGRRPSRGQDREQGNFPSRSASQRSRLSARGGSGTRPVVGEDDKKDKADDKRGSKGRFGLGRLRRSKGKDDSKGKDAKGDKSSARSPRPNFGSGASARPGSDDRPRSSRSSPGRGAAGAGAAGAAAGAAGASRRSKSRGGSRSKPGSSRAQRGKSESKSSSRRSKSRTSASSKRDASSRRRSKSQSRPLPGRKQGKDKSALSMHQGLDFDRKIDLVGVTLVAFALIMFFSVIPSVTFGVLPEADSGLTYALDEILSQLFGWGKLVLPIAAFGVGIWLMRESFEETGIELDYFRIFGMILLFTCALAWVHMIELFDNVQPSVDAFRPYSRELALEDGGGGGWLGHQIYIFLLSQLLDFGTISVLVAWAVIGLMLTFDLSVVEIWTFVAGIAGMFSFIRFTRGDRVQRRAARRMLKTDQAPVLRPGEQPQQLELQQASAGAGLSAATGTPKSAPKHAVVEKPSVAEKANQDQDAKRSGDVPERPGPRINRRGPATADESAESTDTASGEQTRDVSRTPSRRRLPRMQGASDSADADTSSAAKEAAPDAAGEASQNAEQDAETGSKGGGLFGFLRRGKQPDADQDGAQAEADGNAKPDAKNDGDAEQQKPRRRGISPFARAVKDDASDSDDMPDIPVPPRDRDARPAAAQASAKAGEDASDAADGESDDGEQSQRRGIFGRLFGGGKSDEDQDAEQDTGQETAQDGKQPAAQPQARSNARPETQSKPQPDAQKNATAATEAKPAAASQSTPDNAPQTAGRGRERPPADAANRPGVSRATNRDTGDTASKPADAARDEAKRPDVPARTGPRETNRANAERTDADNRFRRPERRADDRKRDDRQHDHQQRGARESERKPASERGKGLDIAGAAAAGAASAALLNRRRDSGAEDASRSSDDAPPETPRRTPRDAGHSDMDARIDALRRMRERHKPVAVSERQGAGADIIPPHRRPVRDISEPAPPEAAADSDAAAGDGDGEGAANLPDRPARPARPDLIARRRESERRRLARTRQAAADGDGKPTDASTTPDDTTDTENDDLPVRNRPASASKAPAQASAAREQRVNVPEPAKDDAKTSGAADDTQERGETKTGPGKPSAAAAQAVRDAKAREDKASKASDAADETPKSKVATKPESKPDDQPQAQAKDKRESTSNAKPAAEKADKAEKKQDDDATQPAEEATQQARSERPAPPINRHRMQGRGPSAMPAARQQQTSSGDDDKAKPSSDGKQASEPRQPERRTHAPAKQAAEWTVPDFRKLLTKGDEQRINDEILLDKARVIEDTLASFGAPGKVVEVNPGPVITQFGVEPDYLIGRGGKKTRIKVNQIAKLDADIALALAAKTIRIEAPVPGKGFVGIEVPNDENSLVSLYDIMDSPEFRRIDSKLRIALGQAVDGAPVAADLTAMPHLLIAGTTGSGKSVCVNSIINCLLLQNTPEDLQFIMVDPKRVELTGYNGIPHLVAPVVVELERIVGVLQWVQREMEERYRKFASLAARNILDYNRKIEDNGEKLPYYVVVVDELADLMMLAPDETERLLARLAQMARATGIHLIISTQRPSVDIITGLIKANFPARIAFAVASSVDSRVILDQPGAEKLLGRGDMLYQSPDAAAPLRMQGVFVSDQEITTITRYWKGLVLDHTESAETLASPNQNVKFNRPEGSGPAAPPARQPSKPAAQTPLWTEEDDEDSDRDELYDEAVELVQKLDKASISLLQRRLRIGYTRAARLIDVMEEDGIVGPQQEGSKPREVIAQPSESGDD